MYREVNVDNDKDFLLQFWREEQASPRWFRESNQTDECTDESFFAFCDRHRIFAINEVALLYTEEIEPNIVKIHFSILRGNGNKVADDLKEIRDQLFEEGAKIIFGYVLRINRPLKRLCKELGLGFNGMVYEGRQCFSIDRRSVFATPDARNLVSLDFA